MEKTERIRLQSTRFPCRRRFFRQLLERRSDKFADARVLLSSRPSQRRSDITRNSHRNLRVRDTWRIEFCEIKTSQRDTDDFARRA